MYPVPESYRQAMAAAVRSERLRGALALADGGVLTFGPADLMSGSVTLDDQCVTGEELQFGCVYLGQAAFQLRTSLSRYRLYGAQLTLTYGLQLADGNWFDLPLGVYTVAEAERTSLCVAIHAYDNILKLDGDYTGPALQGTPYDMLCQIAEHCGLAVGMTGAEMAAWPNAGETFQLDTQDGCATWRDCLAAVAQVVGAFGAADRAGALVLRRFAAEPCRTLGPGARSGAAVADYVCRYRALAVQAGSRRLASEAADAGGLVMTMTEAPLFAKGLPERAQALCDALFASLRAIEYVPASVTGVADPAFDCGDRLTLTEPGEASGLTVAETIVTHRVWKFRGGGTLKGVGKNPYLAAARDKSSAALQQLQTQTASNRLIFYSFVSRAAVTAGEQEQTAAYVNFVTVEKTGALFFAQLLTEARPAQAGGTVTLAVHYYLNGARIGGFAPAQRMAAGRHTLALFYPFTELAADTSNRFEVRLQAAGGTVYTAAGDLRGVVTGQGMAGGAVWDGTLTLEDSLPPPAWDAAALAPGPLQGTAAVQAAAPQACTLTETLPALRWAAGALTLDPLAAQGPDIQQEGET